MNLRALMMTGIWVNVAVAAALGSEPMTTEGQVDAVTVYRGQALVTRLIELPGPAGLREVVVTDLPDQVLPGSLYAESADGVAVRSVRYRERPVRQDVREEVRKIDEQIEAVQQQLAANARHQELAGGYETYLDTLEQFAAATSNVELSKGVLNADTLKTLTLFLFDKRREIADEELRLAREGQSLDGQLNLLRRQREKLTGGSARTVREAVVFVDLTHSQGGRLRLRYLVKQATWSPSYNVRVDSAREGVTVEYNASIQQRSGEDWPDVRMTLSTATPSLTAKAPTLAALNIRLAAPADVQAAFGLPKGKAGIRQFQQQLEQRRRQMADNFSNSVVTLRSGAPAQTIQSDYRNDDAYRAEADLNRAASDLQLLDLLQPVAVSGSDPARPATEEGVSVTYALAERTTLPSRSDRQLIQVAALSLGGEFYRVACPVLTNFVYEEASVLNSSKLVLLAGPISAFVGGEFMGHGDMPTVAVGQRFTVGLGIDSSLRASRRLMGRREIIQGGNRVVSFSYRLAVENFGTTPVAVRVLDRLPKAKVAEIKITLDEPRAALSTDAQYTQTERPQGILRWDTRVPAQAMGTEAFAVEYEFRLEYDKNMAIAGLAMASD